MRVLIFFGFLLVTFPCFAQQPTVSGPLTAADVREIAQLVLKRPDIRKPISDIHADRVNHAEVRTGKIETRKDVGNLFTVAKRHGKWIIDSPIEEERIIVGGN